LSGLCLFCSFLGFVKSVDQLDILKERDSLIDTERLKNIVLELLKLGILVSNFLDILILGLLDLRGLLLDDKSEALFFKGTFCYAEIDHSRVRENSCLELGVGIPGSDVQLEFAVPVDLTVADHNLLLLTNLDVVLGNNVDKSRV